MAGKPIREAFYPLASTPDIQRETFKKLGLDGRSYEERLIEELRQEEEEKQNGGQIVSSGGIPLKQGQSKLILSGGGAKGPQVSMILDKNTNY